MLNITDENQAFWKKAINILTYAIPLAVAALLSLPKVHLGEWTKLLPHLNGMINTATSVLLLVGLFAIKRKNIALHRRIMLSAFSLGALFLVTYILYHMSNEETRYCGVGSQRYLYFFLLLTHILLSLVVVRFVLLAVFHAVRGDFEAHKKIVKWTYPIWLYVSITGVIVYMMISPCYT